METQIATATATPTGTLTTKGQLSMAKFTTTPEEPTAIDWASPDYA